MELPRANIKEMTDPRNRDLVASNTPQLWACYRRSMNRAGYLLSLPKLDVNGEPLMEKDRTGKMVVVLAYPRQQQKVDALNEAMFQTASMGGRGLDALRDAAMGSKPPPQAVASSQQPRGPDGTPTL